MEAAVASAVEYRRIALNDRLRAEREPLPNVRALLAASAEKWEFLAEVTAREDHAGMAASPVP
jgi:hypothetical protein